MKDEKVLKDDGLGEQRRRVTFFSHAATYICVDSDMHAFTLICRTPIQDVSRGCDEREHVSASFYEAHQQSLCANSGATNQAAASRLRFCRISNLCNETRRHKSRTRSACFHGTVNKFIASVYASPSTASDSKGRTRPLIPTRRSKLKPTKPKHTKETVEKR